MALRNAFEEMATESTLDKLYEVLDRLAHELETPRNIPYAKTIADSMRVMVDSGALIYNHTTYFGHQNGPGAWYSTGSPTSLDGRQAQADASNANVLAVRQQRWVL